MRLQEEHKESMSDYVDYIIGLLLISFVLPAENSITQFLKSLYLLHLLYRRLIIESWFTHPDFTLLPMKRRKKCQTCACKRNVSEGPNRAIKFFYFCRENLWLIRRAWSCEAHLISRNPILSLTTQSAIALYCSAAATLTSSRINSARSNELILSTLR